MKKILSVVLAIIMLVACVPIVSAAESHEDAEAFVVEYALFMAKPNDVYNVEGNYETVLWDVVNYLGEDFEEKWWVVELNDSYNLKEFVAKCGERLPEVTAEIKGLNEQLEVILNEKYVRIIDTSEYYRAYSRFDVFLGYGNDVDAYIIETYGEEGYQDALDAADSIYEYFETLDVMNPPADAQEKFDAIIAPFVQFFDGVADCEKGDHPYGTCTDLGGGNHRAVCTFCTKGEIIEAHTWGEYMPDDNGTTATAKCEKCDATDTVEVAWVELPAEDNSNIFTMLLATLRDIFTRISEFFQKLFK